MYMCCCNPFSDKAAAKYLSEKEIEEARATVSEIYRHCSGGEKPQCCSCLPELKNMVHAHNNKVGGARGCA